MITFDLECSNGHRFEGWFKNYQSFEEQKNGNLIRCPICNDSEVRQVISSVNMKISHKSREEDDKKIDYKALAKEFIRYVNENFEDVGPNFTKEALKMHYGVTKKRNIMGSATEKEERILKKEGIRYLKIPYPKIDPSDDSQ